MDYQAILDAGGAIGEPKDVQNANSVAVIPNDHHVQGLEDYANRPLRARGFVDVHDVASFNGYFARFKTDASAIFADKDVPQVVGVIDYHAPEAPDFREHRVTYAPPHSEEWKRWTGRNGRKVSQADFAFFIEENVADIASPDGATMIEVSRSLRAKKNVDFVTEQNLSDGSVQFTYNEDVSGTTTKGNVSVPTEFTLGIAVFFNGVKYSVKALLRYRIAEGSLTVWFDLHRVEYVEQDAFNEIVAEIGTASDAPLFMGRP